MRAVRQRAKVRHSAHFRLYIIFDLAELGRRIQRVNILVICSDQAQNVVSDIADANRVNFKRRKSGRNFDFFGIFSICDQNDFCSLRRARKKCWNCRNFGFVANLDLLKIWICCNFGFVANLNLWQIWICCNFGFVAILCSIDYAMWQLYSSCSTVFSNVFS